jgi:thymidylate synthase
MHELLHVGLTIDNPRQRWIPSRIPALNPAFALAEIVWIINGSNDAKVINYWNPALPQFAGHVEKYHGAYGFRLRNHFNIDQLEKAYYSLQKNGISRQVVLQIWDSKNDMPDNNGKPVSEDIPCNLSSLLKIRNHKLEWMQINRSNDIYRGLPYNIVQFTTLQELIAGWLGIEVGTYNHLSEMLKTIQILINWPFPMKSLIFILRHYLIK